MFKPDSRVLRRTALALGIILALAVLSDPSAKTSQRAGVGVNAPVRLPGSSERHSGRIVVLKRPMS